MHMSSPETSPASGSQSITSSGIALELVLSARGPSEPSGTGKSLFGVGLFGYI